MSYHSHLIKASVLLRVTQRRLKSVFRITLISFLLISCCRCIEDILDSLRLRCHWLHSITWKLCARCDLCLGENEGDDGCSWHHIPSCLHPDCAHFIPLGPDRPLRCDQTMKSKTLLDEDKLKPWLKVQTYALQFSCKLLNLYSSSLELKQRNTGCGTDASVANNKCFSSFFAWHV